MFSNPFRSHIKPAQRRALTQEAKGKIMPAEDKSFDGVLKRDDTDGPGMNACARLASFQS